MEAMTYPRRKEHVETSCRLDENRVDRLERVYRNEILSIIQRENAVNVANVQSEEQAVLQMVMVTKIQSVFRGKIARLASQQLLAQRRVMNALQALIRELSNNTLDDGNLNNLSQPMSSALGMGGMGMGGVAQSQQNSPPAPLHASHASTSFRRNLQAATAASHHSTAMQALLPIVNSTSNDSRSYRRGSESSSGSGSGSRKESGIDREGDLSGRSGASGAMSVRSERARPVHTVHPSIIASIPLAIPMAAYVTPRYTIIAIYTL